MTSLRHSDIVFRRELDLQHRLRHVGLIGKIVGEFFKGWRKKIGLLTLVMACMFAVGWLRSLYSREFIFMEFEIPVGGRIHVYTSANQMDILLQRSTGWYFDFGKVDPIVMPNVLDDVWLFDVHKIKEEIEDEVLQVSPGYEVKVYFYTIVIPLTVLSAYLLLSSLLKKGGRHLAVRQWIGCHQITTEPVPVFQHAATQPRQIDIEDKK